MAYNLMATLRKLMCHQFLSMIYYAPGFPASRLASLATDRASMTFAARCFLKWPEFWKAKDHR